jgi:hypothetical protein
VCCNVRNGRQLSVKNKASIYYSTPRMVAAGQYDSRAKARQSDSRAKAFINKKFTQRTDICASNNSNVTAARQAVLTRHTF